jgi:DNA-directed RNA polymerase subunit RPC12/RpoP
MIIELLRCQNCGRITDQMDLECPCFGRIYKTVKPSWFNIIKWFLGNPKRISALFIQDLREKK